MDNLFTILNHSVFISNPITFLSQSFIYTQNCSRFEILNYMSLSNPALLFIQLTFLLTSSRNFTDDVLQNCTAENYIILLNNVTTMNLIKIFKGLQLFNLSNFSQHISSLQSLVFFTIQTISHFPLLSLLPRFIVLLLPSLTIS